MRELVGECDPEAHGHVGAAHGDAFSVGVVERQRARVLQIVLGLKEIDIAVRQAERSKLATFGLELVLLLVGQLRLIRADAVAVRLGVEEVDEHRLLELQTTVLFVEVHDVENPRVPLLRVLWSRMPARQHDDHRRPDHGDDREYRDRDDGVGGPRLQHNGQKKAPTVPGPVCTPTLGPMRYRTTSSTDG